VSYGRSWDGPTVSLVLAGTGWSYHSYLLSVQQLQAGLAKAATPDKKGFVLVDVRTAEEHRAGMIPGTDFNIDFREIKNRIANWVFSQTIISWSTVSRGIAATLPRRPWRIWAIAMFTMSPAV